MSDGRVRVTIVYEVPWSSDKPQQTGTFICDTLHEWRQLLQKYTAWRTKRNKAQRSEQGTGHFAGANGVLLFSDNIISVTRVPA